MKYWNVPSSHMPYMFRDKEWNFIKSIDIVPEPKLHPIPEEMRVKFPNTELICTGDGEHPRTWWTLASAYYCLLNQYYVIQSHPEKKGLVVNFLLEGISKFSIACMHMFKQFVPIIKAIEGIADIKLTVFTWNITTKHLCHCFKEQLNEHIVWKSYQSKKVAILQRKKLNADGFLLSALDKWSILGTVMNVNRLVKKESSARVLIVYPIETGTTVMIGKAFKRYFKECVVVGICKLEFSKALQNTDNHKYNWLRSLVYISVDKIIPSTKMFNSSFYPFKTYKLLIYNNIELTDFGKFEKIVLIDV